jgi:hypothetical protein
LYIYICNFTPHVEILGESIFSGWCECEDCMEAAAQVGYERPLGRPRKHRLRKKSSGGTTEIGKYVYIFTYKYMCISVCTSIQIHIYMYICIYIYI